MNVIKALLVFVLAGICEIGGGYLIWLWLKSGKPFWYGIAGAIILVCYGIVATWQPAAFGRVYATYGAIFILMSLLWAWKFDNFKPDLYDIIGALVVFAGVLIMFFAPRTVK